MATKKKKSKTSEEKTGISKIEGNVVTISNVEKFNKHLENKTKELNGELVNQKESHMITYKFTKEELEIKAKDLANSFQAVGKLEAELKEVKSQFTFKIDGQNSKIGVLSNHITNGYEMREVVCECIKDFKAGTKEYWFEGVLYDTEKLTDSDYQLKIVMDQEKSEQEESK